MEQVYLDHVLPIAKEFIVCSIYSHELRQLDQEIATANNQKNIHTALDIPDFRIKRDIQKESLILKLTFEKLKLGNIINLLKEKGDYIVTLDGISYQVVFFPIGTIPKLKIKLNKLIFIMFRNDFNKIYYCGKLELKEVELRNECSEFYLKHCVGSENKFTDFRILKR